MRTKVRFPLLLHWMRETDRLAASQPTTTTLCRASPTRAVLPLASATAEASNKAEGDSDLHLPPCSTAEATSLASGATSRRPVSAVEGCMVVAEGQSRVAEVHLFPVSRMRWSALGDQEREVAISVGVAAAEAEGEGGHTEVQVRSCCINIIEQSGESSGSGIVLLA